MQVSDLRAEPDPRGGRIALSWTNPADATFAGVRILRRETSYPRADGQGAAAVPAPASAPGATARLVDANLKPETVYYYSVAALDTSGAASPPAQVSAMTTNAYETGAHLYERLPGVYRNYDALTPPDVPGLDARERDRGQLRRFVEMFGLQFDVLRSFASGARDLQDVRRVRGELLPLLASWIGWSLSSSLDFDKQRNELQYAPHFYRTTGIPANLRATVNRLATWDARLKEFVHHVLLAHHPEQLTLREQQHRDGAWQPSQSVTLDVAHEGRPATLQTTDGREWLFYHARQSAPRPAVAPSDSLAVRAPSPTADHWHVWLKTREQDAWGPARRVTFRGDINKYPTAAQDADGRVWVFWTSYQVQRRQPPQLRLAQLAYGRGTRPARVRSANRGPFVFPDGQLFLINVATSAGVVSRRITFRAEDFDNIAVATAEETAALLDREIPGVRVSAEEDGSLLFVTEESGAGASLQFPLTAIATRLGLPAFATGGAAVAATLTGMRNGPFALAEGDSLSISIDGRAPRVVTFTASDFADITKATAAEVAAAVNRVLPGAARAAGQRLELTSPASESSQVVVEVYAPLLFTLPFDLLTTLNGGTLTPTLRAQFAANGLRLSARASLRVMQPGGLWIIADGRRTYQVRNDLLQLNVYTRAQAEQKVGFGAPVPRPLGSAADCEPSATRDAGGNIWLFWSSLANRRRKIAYSRFDTSFLTWGTPKLLTTGDEPDREPFAALAPTGGGKLWVFWSRRKTDGRWNIFYRTTVNLDFNNQSDGDWKQTELSPAPADYDNREPAVHLQPPDGVTLFFSSNQRHGWQVWTKGITDAAQGAPAQHTAGQFTSRAACPLLLADGSRRLFFRTNQSRIYTSGFYPSAQTLDDRYSGSTTVDTRNPLRIDQRKGYRDIQRYTYDTAKGESDWYARDTVGVYLTPDTDDLALILRRREQIESVLREFLPIQVRAVFVIDQVFNEHFYTYDDPAAKPPALVGEQLFDSILGEVFRDTADTHVADTVNFRWLRTWEAGGVGGVALPDLSVDPPDLSFRLHMGGVAEAGE